MQLFADIAALVDGSPFRCQIARQDWARPRSRRIQRPVQLSVRLVFVGPGGVLASVPPVAPGLTAFNYRLGVPMLLCGTTTFAALARIAMPWFRSAGTYAEQLRKSAEALERFVVRMQAESLARTEHSPQSIIQEQLGPIEQVPMIGQGALVPPPTFPRYPVGAFDLVTYNDNFLRDRWLEAFVNKTYEGRRGAFDYTWQDSAYPSRPPDGLSLQKIADEANDRSRQDYADLQTATGSFRLISAAAWLRFLSTPPDRSETVAGAAEDTRRLIDSGPTTARSPTIFPLTTIEHSATFRRYEAGAREWHAGAGYTPALSYPRRARIEIGGRQRGMAPPRYVGDVAGGYMPRKADKRCNRLRTTFRQDVILSEVILSDGPSPEQPLKTPPNRARLRASTFDWYVPVVQEGSAYLDVTNPFLFAGAQGTGTSGKPMAGSTGEVSIHLAQRASATIASLAALVGPASGPSPLHLSDEIALETSNTIAKQLVPELIERRHAREEDVEVEWQLRWNAGRLEIVSQAGQPIVRSKCSSWSKRRCIPATSRLPASSIRWKTRSFVRNCTRPPS